MNLRTIKKDIEFGTNEFLCDCLTFSEYSGGKKDDQVKELVNEALVLADTSFCKVNDYPAEGTKAYFRGVNKDLYEGFDALYQKLSDLTKYDTLNRHPTGRSRTIRGPVCVYKAP